MPSSTDFVERFVPRTFREFFPAAENLKGLTQAVHAGTINSRIVVSGPTGCGKTTLAMLIAAGINCREETRPCGVCDCCIEAWSPAAFDVHILDCVSQGVKGIRDLRDRLVQVTMRLRHRVVILDEAQRLTPDGQSQLLKVLDQASCYFILCTTDPNRMNRALLNRCTQLRVSPLSAPAAKKAARLILEKAEYKGDLDSAVLDIATRSLGTPRRILILAQDLCAGISTTVKSEDDATLKELLSAPSYQIAWNVLARIKGSPDDVRRRVLSYCLSYLRRNDDNKMGRVAEIFLSPLAVDAPGTDLMLRFYSISRQKR